MSQFASQETPSETSPAGEPSPIEPPPAAFDDPAEEADFRGAQALLLDPPPSRQKTLVLAFSVAAFAAVWIVYGDGSPVDLVLLIGVLLVHELGHAIGMRAFGYRDVRVFFIPLLGAATTGRPRGVSRGKQALVLLLGPLPGLVAACALLFALDAAAPHWLKTTGLILLGVNALNLLPVEPLDGGRLFQTVVFSRHRVLELVFGGLTAALLLAVSLYLREWFLAIVGYLMLAGLPHRARILAGAAKLRGLGWPSDPAALDELQRRTLFHTAWNILPGAWREKWRGKPRPQAEVMEAMLTRATERPPSVLASAGLLGLWLAGLALVVASAIGFVRISREEAAWHRYHHPTARFAIDLPAPVETQTQTAPDRVFDGVAATRFDGAEYSVAWIATPSSEDWLRKIRAQLPANGQVVQDPGRIGDEFRMQVDGQIVRMKLVAGNGSGYIVTVAPADAPHARRVLDSFEPLPMK